MNASLFIPYPKMQLEVDLEHFFDFLKMCDFLCFSLFCAKHGTGPLPPCPFRFCTLKHIKNGAQGSSGVLV